MKESVLFRKQCCKAKKYISKKDQNSARNIGLPAEPTSINDNPFPSTSPRKTSTKREKESVCLLEEQFYLKRIFFGNFVFAVTIIKGVIVGFSQLRRWNHNHKEDQDWQLNRAQCGIRNRSLKIDNQTVSVNARHEVD